MQVWNTQFPILPTRTILELFALCRKWLIGSPHAIWIDSDFPELPVNDTTAVEKSGQRVLISYFSKDQEDYLGFRHQWIDAERREWSTDICGYSVANKFLVGVQLNCQSLDLGEKLPRPKKPYIVRQLLEELGGDLDGPLPVSSQPYSLNGADIELARRIILGETDNFLPVIYVSSTWADTPAVDVNKLAEWASGTAHVVVEPSRRFSFILAEEVDYNNPYEGAVSICWPRGSGRQARFFPYSFSSKERFASVIADTVRKALVGRRTSKQVSWETIAELVARARIERLKIEGSEKLEDYVEAFDSEIQAKDQALQQANNEIHRLKSELARKNNIHQREAGGFIQAGKERELYSGEIRDIIISTLISGRDRMHPTGRQGTILDSIISANPIIGEGAKIQNAIKTALDGCNNVGPKERKALEDIGFSITEDGKHLKLVFRGDDRYTFAMPKSGSDWRGMKNWISDATKILFK